MTGFLLTHMCTVAKSVKESNILGYFSKMDGKILKFFYHRNTPCIMMSNWSGHMIGFQSILNFTFCLKMRFCHILYKWLVNIPLFFSQKDSTCYCKWLRVAK